MHAGDGSCYVSALLPLVARHVKGRFRCDRHGSRSCGNAYLSPAARHAESGRRITPDSNTLSSPLSPAQEIDGCGFVLAVFNERGGQSQSVRVHLFEQLLLFIVKSLDRVHFVA